MPLSYRRAVAADLPFIVALIVADAIGPSSDDASRAQDSLYRDALAAIDTSPNDELYVAELDGEAVGTFQLTFIPGIMRGGMWRGLVESVHVAPAHRNKGIGTRMMGFALARCRQKGCGMVQLTSNKARADAHRFYRRLGFEQSHEGFKLFLSRA
jgi:GNAT superfamily N-acetyltransferase